MSGELDIILVTDDVSLTNRVDLALASNGYRLVTPVLRRASELARYSADHAVPLVLVDAGPTPGPVLTELEQITGDVKMSQTRFIMLADQLDRDLLLQAMQVGIRHVLPKQSIEAELESAIARLAPVVALAAGTRGAVVTVLSAGGGCGATTLALNAAREMSEPDQPAMLVDLDIAYGALAAYLGVETRYGVFDVLAHEAAIDKQLIHSSAASPTRELCLLASPATTRPDDPTPLQYQRLSAMIDKCRLAYRATVIDAPRLPLAVAAELIKASDHALLVFQLSVKDLRMARTMLASLSRHGVARSRIQPVVSRYARRHQMISMQEATRVLGDMPLTCVRNDYRSAIRGLNYGQALADAAPRSTLRSDLQKLVATIRPVAVNGRHHLQQETR
ncbi:MAG: hypothetical protein WDZ31_01735 [Phycisphaeraceae bacterium]